jgi:hypothetical protein
MWWVTTARGAINVLLGEFLRVRLEMADIPTEVRAKSLSHLASCTHSAVQKFR